MPLAAVVDANFFVAILTDERLAGPANQMLREGIEIHVPHNCVDEVGQGLLKHHRRGFISKEIAVQSFRFFGEIPKTTHSAKGDFDAQMFERCLRFNLSTGDYHYIRLAETLGLPLVTADAGVIVNAKPLIPIIDLRTQLTQEPQAPN
jgi:predicted nucleic acid-binding protein